MKISKIRDVFGIKKLDEEIDLAKNNIIYASNATGKTSITRIIKSLFEENDTNILRDHYPNGKEGQLYLDENIVSFGSELEYNNKYNVKVIDPNDIELFMRNLANSWVNDIFIQSGQSEYKELKETLVDLKSIFEIFECENFGQVQFYFEIIDMIINSNEEENERIDFSVFQKLIKQYIANKSKAAIDIGINLDSNDDLIELVSNIKDFFDKMKKNEHHSIYNKYSFEIFKGVTNRVELRDKISQLKNNSLFKNGVLENSLTINLDEEKIKLDEYLDLLDSFIQVNFDNENVNCIDDLLKVFTAFDNKTEFNDILKNNSLPKEIISQKIDEINKSLGYLKDKNITKDDFDLLKKYYDIFTDLNEDEDLETYLKNKFNNMIKEIEIDTSKVFEMSKAIDKVKNAKLEVNGVCNFSIFDECIYKWDGVPMFSFEGGDNVNLLSSGEKHLIVMALIQTYIVDGYDKNILILDDIGDPFDYKFKHLFVNLLSKIMTNKNVKITIFIHNFDFLSSLYNSLNKEIKKSILVRRLRSVGDEHKFDKIDSNYLLNYIQYNNFDPSVIPMIRNTLKTIKVEEIEIDGININTNDLVHYRKSLIEKNISSVLNSNELSPILNDMIDEKTDGLYYEVIKSIANDYLEKTNLKFTEEMKAKMTLALSLRLIIEEHCFKLAEKGDDKYLDIYKSDTNGTTFAFTNEIILKNDELSKKYPKLADEINYIIPDYQHFDSRTYSPLVDTDFTEVKKIYKETIELILNLNNQNIEIEKEV